MSHNPVPLIPVRQAMNRDTEIDQIKRELNILRTRYALYGRMGRVLKVFFTVWMPLFASVLLAIAIKLIRDDMLSGMFFLGILLTFGLLIIRLIQVRGFRWIDFASSRVYGDRLNPYFAYPNFDRYKSDTQLIEEQIAERERRLSQLGRMPRTNIRQPTEQT
jgi:hypothetical protein